MIFGGKCKPQARNVFKKHEGMFFLGGVKVTVSWCSSGYDGDLDSKRLVFDNPLR